MKKRILLFFTVLYTGFSYGQCPVAGFTVQSPICGGNPLTIANTSSGAASYHWNFCPYKNFDSTAIGDFGNTGGLLANIYNLRLVKDSIYNYAFAVNTSGDLIRLDFGTDMDNTPTATLVLALGTGDTRAAVSFTQVNNNWYGFTCNYNGDLYRLDFGNALTNIPTVTNVNVLMNGSIYCMDLAIDSGAYYLMIGSYNNKNITVVNLGSNILNLAPTTAVLPSALFPGAGGLQEVDMVHECGNWYAVVMNYFGFIYKLDFGSSLNNNAPSSTTLFSLSSANLRGAMNRLNDSWYYFFYTRALGVKIINFGSSMTNNSPTMISSGTLDPGAFGTIEANDFLLADGEVFGVSIPYTTPSVQSFKYKNTCHASLTESTDFEPAGLSYSQGGAYGIQLIAYDSLGNSAFAYDSIVVSASPVSAFSVLNTCESQVTDFTDLSTIVGGTIDTWKWFFGDGDSSGIQSPSHSYTATGTYNVRLVSYANSGCTDTVVTAVPISATPSANFLSLSGCSDHSLQFTDSSTIASGSIVGWQWDFGDASGTSINQNPFYLYPDGGLYTVSLTVNSDSGCSGSASKQIHINSSPDGAFQVTNTCVGQIVQFINQSVSDTTILSYSWDFGDLTTDTAMDPTHTYAAVVASYPVTLVANAANGCNDTVNQLIKINNIPSVSFSYSPVNACEENGVVFTDLSTVAGDTISKWSWAFGDGFTDTVANPIHAFSTSGNYTVSLIAFSATSCGNSTTQNISVIESPEALFTYTAVCLGSTTLFMDQSVVPSGSLITRYHWDFGDGDSSSAQNPMHDFLTSGSHQVILTVETNFGCTDQDTLSVIVHPPPVASFNFTNPCSDYPIDFNSTSSVPVPYTISSYLWGFGDPASGLQDTSTLPAPSHSYDTTFSYAVTLIVTTNAGCADTVFQVLNVKQSSIVNFQYSPTCRGDYTDFANLSTPPSIDTAWFWKFGDGQFSILREPAHYYISAGQYLVTLTATASNGCVSEATKTVTVSPIPVADFVNNPICIGVPYQFQDNSSIAAGSALASWKWVVSGLDSSSLQNPSFTFPDTGTYLVTLTVTSTDSCRKSVTKTVRVYPLPVANFVFSPQYGNPPLMVTDSNLSTGASTYQWDFGNGLQSTLVNPTTIYQDTGQYFIQLVSRSSVGCSDTAVKSIYVIKPLLDLAIRNIYSHILDNHFYLSAEVINLGTRDVTSFNISADVDNGNSIRETYTGVLPNGSQGILFYDFNASFELTPGQDIHYFCIHVSEPNGEQDNVPSNDETCSSLESTFSLKAPYPNPFTSGLTIEIILPYSDILTIEIFDLTGKKIRELYNGTAGKGLTTVQADLQGLAGGVYTLKCTFRDEVIVHPILKSNLPK